MSSWIEIGTVDDIPPLGSRVVRTPVGDIAIFRAARDTIFALDDRCPHKGGPISEGIVHGEQVTCPLHNQIIDLKSGAFASGECGQSRTHPVKVENGVISIALDVSQMAAAE
ncbi:nitrite reductase small subunit NirD [Varunaivibrio sulfuroxidans]|uniref:Assimilatory nitrite reductase (NAD(P)H) small subunit n=1 Tax=Varunaivibrio sulfuroxidans TaxID=1773489 RepID=A0A4R3JAF0_9PROT|nr:nitrite reductase small subunit NirD [Varunaivibrio sulfuroxidans]TCS62527.1 assimilatory nitrite reductase (NAD(P)H) small subunit [Varunaivibrio sulfuroxidans]WES30802.1 nitrite reductase small subunit NirD [Varunaivibrio sulfuroxidans]